MKAIVSLKMTHAELCLEFVRVLIMTLLWLWEIYILTQFPCSTEAVSLIGRKAVTNPQHTHCIRAGDAALATLNTRCETAFWI